VEVALTTEVQFLMLWVEEVEVVMVHEEGNVVMDQSMEEVEGEAQKQTEVEDTFLQTQSQIRIHTREQFKEYERIINE
jgi:uncharacterized protein YbcV (DUF1398 family)